MMYGPSHLERSLPVKCLKWNCTIKLGHCRGIVTADVLVQGLSHGAIVTRKLKGVKRDKGHEDYTGSAPYGEGKSLLQLRWNYLGFR